ncbi:hypothetical protein CRUP_034297 [Coryphaenoides rupestris]|nr:hypothetical protein CRUP_034297 [Coryphaenoides rupestris]
MCPRTRGRPGASSSPERRGAPWSTGAPEPAREPVPSRRGSHTSPPRWPRKDHRRRRRRQLGHSDYQHALNDFLTYLQPINIYPSVVPLGLTLADVSELLKPMHRNQAAAAAFVYRPLGELKRTRAERPAHQCGDSDSGNGLFEGPDLAPTRKKLALNQEEKVKEWSPVRDVYVEEPFPLDDRDADTATATASLAALHFVDCTESNDEEDGEEEEEEVEMGDEGATAKARSTADRETGVAKAKGGIGGTDPRPKWDDFFHADSLALPDSQGSQGSLASLSQSCCSAPSTSSPSRMTGSQTPELFSDPESTDEAFGGPDKPPSNPGGLGQGPTLPDTLILRSKQQQEEEGGAKVPPSTKGGPQREGGDCQENLPDSQTSSDFDIPCTPESQAPKAEELSQLYRTLASGEEVAVLGTGRQRSM